MADITEGDRAEQELRESEARYRALVESARDAIFTIAADGTIASLNPAFETITGWPRAEWIGKSIGPIIHAQDLPLAMEIFQNVFLHGETPPVFELRVLSKSGDYLVGEFTVTPQRQNERVVSALGIARDVTERKRTEEALRLTEEQLLQAQKMEAVGKLAGGIAHDFNNLLTIITGYSQLIIKGLSQRDPLRSEIEEIKKAGERAASLTQQLLAFSRRQVLMPKVLDLNAIVATMEGMLQRLLGEDIHLVTALDPALGPVKADPGQLEQVIMNLVVNAREAMPQGGKLIIETETVEIKDLYHHGQVVVPGRYAMLAVSDTGCGMDAATQSHLFEPFFTTKGQGKGTGLGLSTVYGIV
ncbi:MAG: PAS domain S-box protein, partial [Nitrospirota bacterium]